MKSYRIATIPGDGIGKEVVPEGIRVLEAAGRKHGFSFQWNQFPWSCEFYQKTGRMMPEDGLEKLKGHEAFFLGACASSHSRSSSPNPGPRNISHRPPRVMGSPSRCHSGTNE